MTKPSGPKLLSKFLAERDMLDRELASAVGVHISYIGYLRRGERMPGLAIALGIERHTDGAVPATSWV